MKRLLSLFNRITHYASRITVLLAFSLSPLAISLFITSAFAEEKTASLEEIVVTDTRTEKELIFTPSSVSVVTNNESEKRNVKTVDESLNTLPDVFNSHSKWLMDIYASVTLREIPEKTLILMDDIILNNAYSGRELYKRLAVEDIEKIDVVKGQFLSLYDSYAMASTANTITKMPKKRNFTLKTGYGSSFRRGDAMDDLRKFYLSYDNKFKDKLSLFLSYGYKATNGYPSAFNVQKLMPPTDITGWTQTTDNQGNTRYLIGDKGDNRWWDDNITLKAGYDFSKATKVNLSFVRTRYEYNYDDPHTYLRNASGNEVWSYGSVKEFSFLSSSGGSLQDTYDIGFETEISTLKTKLNLGMVDLGKNWNTILENTATRTGGPGKVSEAPLRNYNADIQFTMPLFERHILTFGGSLKHRWTDTQEHKLTNWKDEDSKTDLTYQLKVKDRTYTLFLQNEITILDNLTAYLGFRHNWWETYDGYVNDVGKVGYPKEYDSRDASAFSPKAAIVYKPFEKTTLRTSIGRAFRPPTVFELYYMTYSRGIIYIENPDLKSETTTLWDIRIEQGLWRGGKIKAAYFENYLKDLIYINTPFRPRLLKGSM